MEYRLPGRTGPGAAAAWQQGNRSTLKRHDSLFAEQYTHCDDVLTPTDFGQQSPKNKVLLKQFSQNLLHPAQYMGRQLLQGWRTFRGILGARMWAW